MHTMNPVHKRFPTKLTIGLICIGLAISVGSYSFGAVLTWGLAQTVAGTADVSTDGIYFGSWAPGNAGANTLPVNGVTFQGFNDFPSLSSDFGNSYNGFGNPGTANANYNGLLTYGAYQNGTTAFVTVGGMDPSHHYEVQLWVEDVRNLNQTRTETVSGSPSLLYPANGSGPGQFVIGKFFPDPTGTVTLNFSANSSAQLNLMQIRDLSLPEPSTLLLLGVGGFIMQRVVRRRKLSAVAGAMVGVLLLSGVAHAGLVAYYPFNEGSFPPSSTISDASGNGRDLVASGTSSSVPGVFGTAINFGTGGSALARTGSFNPSTITSFNGVTGNQVTITAWVQANADNQFSSPFYVSDASGSAGNRIFQSHFDWGDNNLYWDVANGVPSSGYQRISGSNGGNSVTDQFHFYAWQYNGNNGSMAVYRDGGLYLQGTGATSAGLPWSYIQNFELGALSFVSGWNGRMDEFGIWNEMLSGNQLQRVQSLGVLAFNVPEPTTLLMLGLGGLVVWTQFRRRR